MRSENANAIPPPAQMEPLVESIFAGEPVRSDRPPPVKPLRPASVGSSAPIGSPALLLACGNTLRQDDAVAWRIAEAAERIFPASRLRVVVVHQFTPEMATEVAQTELAIFVDASACDEPGSIRVVQLDAAADSTEPQRDSHRLDPVELMSLAQSLCGHAPEHAFVLTIGASRFDYGEELSRSLQRAVPRAVRLLTSLLAAFAAER